MDIVQRIDTEIERRSLLKHSFYQMWSEGKLTIDHLQRGRIIQISLATQKKRPSTSSHG